MKPIEILLIEDNPGDVRLVREMLAENGTAMFSLEVAEQLQEGLVRLAQGGLIWSCLISGCRTAAGLTPLLKRMPEYRECRLSC